MNLRVVFKEPWPRIIGIPIVSVIMTFVYRTPPYEFQHFLISFVMTSVIWQGDYTIIMKFRDIWPSFENVEKRIAISLITVFVYNTAVDLAMCEILARGGVKEFVNWSDYLGSKMGILMITSLIIGTFYETGYYFSKWKNQALETEQIKSQQLKSELSVLKNQISPHFLFNSLNTLMTLINENQDKAVKFTEKLSEVYRYILQYKEKEIVDLQTELNFAKAYVYLMKMRFEDSLTVSISIDEQYLKFHTVPLTLQMLIENAIKHNIVSASKPLTIDIYIENGKSLIVRNNLQKKSNPEKSLKTGLKNVGKRYHLLSDREVDIIETRDHFMVALPLIHISDEMVEKITSDARIDH